MNQFELNHPISSHGIIFKESHKLRELIDIDRFLNYSFLKIVSFVFIITFLFASSSLAWWSETFNQNILSTHDHIGKKAKELISMDNQFLRDNLDDILFYTYTADNDQDAHGGDGTRNGGYIKKYYSEFLGAYYNWRVTGDENKKKEAMQKLGWCIHLVQDMSVPAHAFNIQHATKGIPNFDNFEETAQEFFLYADPFSGMSSIIMPTSVYPPSIYSDARNDTVRIIQDGSLSSYYLKDTGDIWCGDDTPLAECEDGKKGSYGGEDGEDKFPAVIADANSSEFALLQFELQQAVRYSAKFLLAVDRVLSKPISLDLVFLIDTTGSMSDDIAMAKSAAVDIVNNIASQTTDYRIAIVDFEDFPYYPYGYAWCGDYMYHDVLNFSIDKSAIVSAIQGLPIRCGEDWQEAHYSALIHVLQKSAIGGWRDGVKKVVIVMTDAPPHDPEPYTGYTSNDVINAAIALDPAIIYPIVIGGDSYTTAYMESLAEGTGGQVFNASNASGVVSAIIEAINTAVQSPVAEAGGPYTGNINSPVTFDASGSYDPDGSIVLYEWDWNNDGTYDSSAPSPTITHTWTAAFNGTVKLRVTDNTGLTAIDTAFVTISGNRPPVANAGPDQTVSANNVCLASISLNGTGSTDPDGDALSYIWTGPFGTLSGSIQTVSLPLGVHVISLAVSDGKGGEASDTVTINVVDQTAPIVTNVNVNPNVLWPPDHRMLPVSLGVSVSDNCDANPVCKITSVSSNEPENGLGDGDTAPDWLITGDLTLKLRAERSGKGSGRIYMITTVCTDASNNSAIVPVSVSVPHSM